MEALGHTHSCSGNYGMKDLNRDSQDLMELLTLNVRDEHFGDCKAIPYPQIIELVNFLPFGSEIRVMAKIQFELGCRNSELDRLSFKNPNLSFVKGGRVYWRTGKNQKGQWRNEPISVSTFKELLYYRQNHKVYNDKFFGIKWTTYRRIFNKKIRPHLGSLWNAKEECPDQAGITHYKLQLKGLRKSWATLKFARLIDEWGGSVEAALAFISKKMRHSNQNITVTHYLENFKALEIEKWKEHEPGDILALADQSHLQEYAVDYGDVKVFYDDPQRTLKDDFWKSANNVILFLLGVGCTGSSILCL